MKVLQVLGWPLSSGGHISSTYALAREMQRHDVEVHITAPSGPMAKTFVEAGLRFTPCSSLVQASPLHLLAFPGLALTARRCGAQLIHAMDYKSLYPAYLAAAYNGIPLFFTKAGGVVPSYKIPDISNLIVFSEELRLGMGMKYADLSGRMVLIKERIDTDLFSPAESFSSSDNQVLRLFMAMRFEEGKRVWLEGAISGMRILASRGILFELTLAGGGPLHNELETIATEVRRSFPNAGFRFLGTVSSPHAMVQHYRAADVVIGHGRGVLEAMACAKPVVVVGSEAGATLVEPAKVDAICEYNFSGRHIRAYPETASELAEILVELSKDAEKRGELGKFSRHYVETEYSIKVGVSKLVKLYQQSLVKRSCNTFPSAVVWLLRSAYFRRRFLINE